MGGEGEGEMCADVVEVYVSLTLVLEKMDDGSSYGRDGEGELSIWQL